MSTTPTDLNLEANGGVISTLIFCSVLFVLFMPFWLFWRRKFPTCYFPRKLDDPAQNTWFQWILPTFLLKGVGLLHHSGMNGFLFLEWKETSFIFLSILSIFGIGILIPVNLSQADISLTSIGFDATTASVIPANSNLSWITFCYCLLIFICYLVLIFIHRKRYYETKLRHENLGGGYLHVAMLSGIPKDFKDEKAIKLMIEEKLGDTIHSVSIVWKGGKAIEYQSKRLQALRSLKGYQRMFEETNERPMFRPSKHDIPGIFLCYCHKIDAIQYYEKKYEEADEKLREARKLALEERKHKGKAFVVFSSFAYRQFVIESWDDICGEESNLEASSWEFNEVRPIDEIYWENINVKTTQRLTTQILATIFIFILALFWTIPIAFFSNLEILEDIPVIGDYIEKILDFSPFIFSLIESFLPALMQLALFTFIPYVCLYISKPEKHDNRSDLRASAMVKYWIFIIFNSYIFYLLFSSGIDLATALFTNPKEVREAFEGLDWATYGSFYSNYLITLALYDVIFDFLRIDKLIKSYIFRYVARNGTEEEKKEVFAPSEFKYFVYFAKETVYFAMIMTFAPIVPLVTLCGLLAYVMTYFSQKNTIVLCSKTDPGQESKMLFRFACFISISMLLTFLFWIFFFSAHGPASINYLAVPCFVILWVVSLIILFGSRVYARFFIQKRRHPSQDESVPVMSAEKEIEDICHSYSWEYITDPNRESNDPLIQELLE